MVLISKTGLLEGLKHPVQRHNQTAQIEFPNVARPAPYILKPFAGIYNPFPYGCSILCNHPADYEAKDVVRRAKDSWSTEGKALLLPEELSYEDGEDAVPEELFRRYTDTDSRPLTPAPTLASARTRGSGRRCVTPDPLGPTRERTLLVLDLRRSHSQDTLSWQGISYTQPKSPCASTISITPGRRKACPRKKQPTTPEKVSVANKLQVPTIRKTPSSPEPSILLTDTTVGSGDEEITKRRGKRKKRGKKAGREGSQEFQGLAEPGETQVSAIGGDSRSTSARPSLTLTPSPCIPEETAPAPAQELLSAPASRRPSSFLQPALLRTLQRDLDHEVVDCEFDPKRRRALEEALKTRVCEKVAEGVLRVKKELVFPPPQTDLWLSLPRVFSRQSARFTLPFDSRDLNTLKPLQYLQQYVTVTSSRKLLYNTVFNRHREDDGVDRRIIGKNVVVALGEVMGSPLTEDQTQYYQGLVGWDDGERLDFRQWCGVAAACERLLGPRYIAKTPPRSEDPCHEVERADFGSLPRRLRGLNPDPRLLTILNAIREL